MEKLRKMLYNFAASHTSKEWRWTMGVLRATEVQRSAVMAQLDSFMSHVQRCDPARKLVVFVTEATFRFGAITIPSGVSAILWAGGAHAVTFTMSDGSVSVFRNGDISDTAAPHDDCAPMVRVRR